MPWIASLCWAGSMSGTPEWLIVKCRLAAPRRVGEWRRRRGSGERVSRHGRRERAAAAQERAAVKQAVSGHDFELVHGDLRLFRCVFARLLGLLQLLHRLADLLL